MKDGKVMLNKLKQYKFSPRTKEEMKQDFNFIFDDNANKNTSQAKDDGSKQEQSATQEEQKEK